MAKIDKLKEQLGILKFWMGIVVACIIGTIAWVFTNFKNIEILQIVISIITIFPMIIIYFIINEKINEKLDEIEKE